MRYLVTVDTNLQNIIEEYLQDMALPAGTRVKDAATVILHQLPEFIRGGIYRTREDAQAAIDKLSFPAQILPITSNDILEVMCDIF